MHEDEYTNLADEVATIAIDRSRSVRAVSYFNDSDLAIYLNLQCETHLRPNGALAAVHVVGLLLQLWVPSSPTESQDRDHRHVIISRLIKYFHDKLSTFPHLRVVELCAPLIVLQHAVEVAPEISQLPTLGGRLLYQWACPQTDFKDTQSPKYDAIGVDPVTLEPTGT